MYGAAVVNAFLELCACLCRHRVTSGKTASNAIFLRTSVTISHSLTADYMTHISA